MIVPAQIRRKFNQIEPYIEIVRDRVQDTVLRHCMDGGFAFVARSKTVESLAEKIESGRFERWSELDDLFACTVVVPTLAEEDAILEFLNERFQMIAVRQRGTTQKSPDVFRFDATRFIGRLHDVPGVSLPSDVYKIAFEIQICSAFEHAWASATHALVYKSDNVDWKRHRLAAQLKSAVEQLDNLIVGFEGLAKTIPESPWPESRWRASVATTFQALVARGDIPTEAGPKDWSRFSDNVLALLRASKRWPRYWEECDTFLAETLQIITNETRVMTADRFPRSVSLLQYVFGILSQRGFFGVTLRRFFVPVTDEFKLLFPEVGQCTSVFQFDA